MSIVNRNFHHDHVVGQAMPPQVITEATVNGATISEPWRVGRSITFLVNSGAWAATASGLVTLEGLQRDDGTTWAALKEGDGVADLAFEPTLFDDAGGGEGTVLIGTLPLSRVDSTTYKAIRIVFEAEIAAIAMPEGITYIIYDLFERVSGDTDYLFSKLQKATVNP